MRSRCGMFVVCVAMFTGVVCPLTAVTRSVIRVYDGALPPDTRRVVVSTAAAIVRDAGVDVEWVECAGRPAPDPRCRAPRADGDLIIRIVADGDVPAPDGQFPLGSAVVDEARGVGTLATVFADRVRRVGRESLVNVDVLLGRAVAHEVGHLLLRSRAHSRTGLMREVWTDAELFRNRAEDWVFSPDQRARLRQTFPITEVATN